MAGFGQVPEPFVDHDDEGLAQGEVAPGDVEGDGLDDDAAAAKVLLDNEGGAALGAEQDGNGLVVAGVKLVAAENAEAVNVEAMGVGEQDGGGMVGGRRGDGGELLRGRGHRRRGCLRESGREAGAPRRRTAC